LEQLGELTVQGALLVGSGWVVNSAIYVVIAVKVNSTGGVIWSKEIAYSEDSLFVTNCNVISGGYVLYGTIETHPLKINAL
jgi:hypothetical protein